MRAKIDTKKYMLAFVVTALVFFGALLISNRFSQKRIEEIKSIENNIALDILASETQFALLKESSCRTVDHRTAFSEELNNLAQKLSYTEENLGDKNKEVIDLKKYYSLLQVKDYLLVGKVNEKCGIKPVTSVGVKVYDGDWFDATFFVDLTYEKVIFDLEQGIVFFKIYYFFAFITETFFHVGEFLCEVVEL